MKIEHILSLFATQVVVAQVPDHERLNATLLQRIKKIRRRQPTWKGHTSPWQCPPTLQDDPVFAPLVKHIRVAADEWLGAYRFQVQRLEITAMWANSLQKGEVHRPHMHANNLISGVYYMVASEGDGLTLMHPNPGATAMLPTVSEWTEHNSGEWRVPATPGRMVLFPSWCRHWVPPTVNPERVSVAFNLLPRGKMSTPDSLQGVTF